MLMLVGCGKLGAYLTISLTVAVLLFSRAPQVIYRQPGQTGRTGIMDKRQWSLLTMCDGWKILKFFTHPTSPYVLVNSILNIGNSQNFHSSYSIRHSPWRADEWIFPALCDWKLLLGLGPSEAWHLQALLNRFWP